MPKLNQAAEFFVVGGPVQPDRPCYVERASDVLLETAIRNRRFCCVLGPPATGKSSLMGRVSRALRKDGELTAILDLRQVGARAGNGDADRWNFNIAQKVAQDLRLKVDLASWWQGSAAGERRLIDFFWEVVLTNTTAAVTVFIDEIERTLASPSAQELFDAISACYARRTAEPDYGRLNFVVLGAASVRQLAGDDRGSPLHDAQSIEIFDFTAEESYRLAAGFGGEQEQAHALMDRVCVWTNGHPYLTQKIARGVARKGGKLEDVERVVREQLLSPSAAQEEPLLHHMRAQLSERSPRARRAVKLLRKLAKGGKVAAPPDPAALDLLQLSGVVVLDAARVLHYRNRICEDLFGGRWFKGSWWLGWQAWTAAAATVVVATLGGYWYTQYLPLAYVATLSNAAAEPAALEAAYRQLHGLPGFAERADGLLEATLMRRSGSATTLAAAVAVDTQLRTLLGQDARADQLLAEFWLREAQRAAHAEQRDAALLFALRAAAIDTPENPSAALVGELLSDDYARLERTLRLPAAPTHWRMNWQQAMLLTLDSERQLQRVPFGAVAGVGAVATAPVYLSALQHSALTREILVDGAAGSAGAFELTLAIQHPAGGELLVTVTAPSGAQGTVLVPRSNSERLESYVFVAVEGSPLAALADEARRGVWRLTIVDRRIDNAGSFGGWILRFGEEDWRDAPAVAVAIPEPVRTDAVTMSIGAAGEYAIVQPAQPSTIGTVALWDLADGRLHNDFTMPTVPQHVEVNSAASRLLVAAANLVTLWNLADGMPVARLTTQTEFVLPPVFSADGGYVAIAERVEDARPLYSLLRADDGALLASVEGIDTSQSWLLGPGARYLALLGPASVVRVLDPRRGVELRQLRHVRDVHRVLPLPDGLALLTVDAGGEIRSWQLAAGGAASAAAPRLLGTAIDAGSVELSVDGSRLAYTARDGEVIVLDVGAGGRLASLRSDRSAPPTSLQFAPDGARLATASGERFRLWTLPPAGTTSAVAAAEDLTTLGLDREAELVAVGLRSGQLRVAAPADLGQAGVAPAALDYFGHRGAIDHVALNAARGLVATGGSDGAVRLWDLATVAPIGAALQHAEGQGIAALALSGDGRFVASAVAGSVRVANVADGAQIAVIPLNAPASAVAFAPDGSLVGIGDRSGQVAVAPLRGRAQPFGGEGDAAISSIVFAPSGEYLAVGDAAGRIRVLRSADGGAVGAAQILPQPIRSVVFSADGSVLFAATDYWLHSFAVAASGVSRLHSRLAPRRFAPGSAIAAAGGERVRVAGYDDRGELGVTLFDLAAPSAAALAVDVAVRERGWPAALGLRLDEAGNPLQFNR